jgi:hypothetical protein
MAPAWVRAVVGSAAAASGWGCAGSAIEDVATAGLDAAPAATIVANGFAERRLVAQSYTDEVTAVDRGRPREGGLEVVSGSSVVRLGAEHGDWALDAFAVDGDGRIVPLAVTAAHGRLEIAAPPPGTYVVYVDGLDVHSDVRTVRYVFRWDVH